MGSQIEVLLPEVLRVFRYFKSGREEQGWDGK